MRSTGRLSLTIALLVLTVAVAPAQGQFSFEQNEILDDLVATQYSQGVALADVNRDGKADILAAGTNDADVFGVKLYLNDGSGGFSDQPDNFFSTGPNPVAVAVGDFDRDGNLDFVTVNNSAGTVTTYFGDGTGNFSAQRDWPVDTGPVAVVVRDLNGDRADDLAVLSDQTVHLLKSNAGDRTFSNFNPASIRTNGRGGFAIGAGNFDTNSNIDLAITNKGTNQVSVFLGNGDGTFGAATLYPVGNAPQGIAVADFDKDAFDDIMVVNSGASLTQELSLLTANGNGTFAQAVTMTGPEAASVIAAGDFNGDGYIDLALGVQAGSDSNMAILQNCGPESQQATICPGPVTPEKGFRVLNVPGLSLDSGQVALQAGDLNGVGNPDLIGYGVDDVGDPCSLGVFVNTSGMGITPTPNTPGTTTPGSTTPGSTTPTPPTSPTSAPTGPTHTPTPTVTSTLPPTPTAIPTVPYTVCNTNELTPRINVGQPAAVASGDFNADGGGDIAVADSAGDRIVVILSGVGAATPDNPACDALRLQMGTDIPGVTAPIAIVTQDIDLDGQLDLAIVGSGGVSVFFGDGKGTFQPGPRGNPMTAGTTPKSIAVADFNRDGYPDLAVANEDSSDVSIFVNNKNRTFQQDCRVATNSRPRLVVTSDFNVDGKPDFAVSSDQTNDVTVFLQTAPSGTPTPGFSCMTLQNLSFRSLNSLKLSGARPTAVSVGIFDFKDRVPDLAVAAIPISADGVLLTFLGSSMGTNIVYQQRETLTVPPPSGTVQTQPSALGVADVNRDGRSDLIVTDENNNDVVIFLARNDGSFDPTPLLPFPINGTRPVALVVTDLEGDAQTDVVIANAGEGPVDGSISVLVGSVPPATPTSPPATATPPPTATLTPTMATPTSTPSVTRTPSATPLPSAVPTNTFKPGTVVLSKGCTMDPVGTGHGACIPIFCVGALLLLRRWRIQQSPLAAEEPAGRADSRTGS